MTAQARYSIAEVENGFAVYDETARDECMRGHTIQWRIPMYVFPDGQALAMWLVGRLTRKDKP